jgi:hypothetical protein
MKHYFNRKRNSFTEDDIGNLNAFRINILSTKPLFCFIFSWKIINSDYGMMQIINIKSSKDGRLVRYFILPSEGRTTSFKSACRVYSMDSVNERYATS